MMDKRKTWLVLPAALLATAAGGAIAADRLAQPAPDRYVGVDPAPRDRPETAAPGAPVNVADAKRALSVLERDRTAADRVPAAVARTPLLADNPAVLAAARRVRGIDGDAWIAPSTNGQAICYFTRGSLACPSAQTITRDGAAIGAAWHVDTPVYVTGVAADSVESVTIVRGDGSRQTVDVVDNYFALAVAEMPREARWNGPRGPEVFRFPTTGR